MNAAKPPVSHAARRLALLGCEPSLKARAESLGWTVAGAETGRATDLLIADMGGADERLMAALAAHKGPVVALVDDEDEALVTKLLSLGVRQFVPRDDALMLRAALEAAWTEMRAESVARPSAELRRRESDNGFTALIDWLGALADEGEEASLIFADFPSVERVNASHGVSVGDLLLLRASRRLAAFCRRTEMVGSPLFRISGSRFCLGALQALSAERMRFLASELHGELAAVYRHPEGDLYLPACIATVALQPGEKASECISRGLSALERAGDRTPAICVEPASGENEASFDERQIEKDLRHAIGRGEIDIVYQPQFAFADGRIVGAEALARWNHDRYGPLGAGVLFSVAARSNYLLPLSHYIHERALSEAAGWSGARAGLRLSLNVTPQDLVQPDFRRSFLAKLAASGLPPERLTVEITETGLMRDIKANARILRELRAEGMAIAVDDFGTGYSSLAWLKELPLDYMKLDHGLTADILSDDRGRIVVRSVIALGKALGLKIVAEGVESEEQEALLAEEGCDIFQGFLRAAPLSAENFKAFVEKDTG